MQIAKSFGAEVTAVCSTKNIALVKLICADHAIDYTRIDFTTGTQHYDLIVDIVATHSLLECRRVLTPAGTYVMVGMVDPGKWFAWLAKPLWGMILAPLVSQRFSLMIADLNARDLAELGALMQSGNLTR